MLFSSYGFVFVFLPIALSVFYFFDFLLGRRAAKCFLLMASLVFFAWDHPGNLMILIVTILVNFNIGLKLGVLQDYRLRRVLLVAGMVFNVAILGYYKYSNFFFENVGHITGQTYEFTRMALPLGISFFTFQQMSYLIDVYKNNNYEKDIIEYSIFVSFFPQLIAGPIVLHNELIPQLNHIRDREKIIEDFALGIKIFSIGLFKKLVLADAFSLIADRGFEELGNLSFLQAWITSLSYTMQIYYDFSGYCDMAIGLGLLFGVRLPMNFNSPYKSKNISEFWRRWHITLGRSLSTYIYLPMGGSRSGFARTCFNLFLTFIVSGLWHGAAWTFVLWGALHGSAIVIHKCWEKSKLKLPSFFAVSITFLFVNFAWVLFRAHDFSDVARLWSAMVYFKGAESFVGLNGILMMSGVERIINLPLLITALIGVFVFPNAIQISRENRFCRWDSLVTSVSIVLAILCMGRISPFIYYNF